MFSSLLIACPVRAALIGSMSPIMSAMVTSGVASFSTYRSSAATQATGVSSPSTAILSRHSRQIG